MLIPPRVKGLDNKGRHEEKTRIALEWIVTYRFSNQEIISALLGHKNAKVCSRFFKNLFDKELIQAVEHSEGKLLIMLTNKGASYIDGACRPRTREHTRKERIESKKEIRHDLLVQKCALRWVTLSSEIVDGRLTKFRGIRPDSLFFYKDSQVPVSIEYERTKKSDDDIKRLLIRYKEAIINGHIASVIFYFSSETLKNIYENHFKCSEFRLKSVTVSKGKDGKELKKTSYDTVKFDADDSIRKRFHFKVFTEDEFIPVVDFEESCQPKYVPNLEYTDRLLEKARLEREEELREEAKAKEQVERERIRTEAREKVESEKRELKRRANQIRQDIEYEISSELYRLRCEDSEAERKRKDSLLGISLYFPKAPAFEARMDALKLESLRKAQAENSNLEILRPEEKSA